MVDLKNLFGLLDRDGDGDTDLQDLMGLVQDPSALGSIFSSNPTDPKAKGMDDLLSGAIQNIATGSTTSDAQNKLEKAGISAGSIGDLIGGFLGKDTSTKADKSMLDSMLGGALTSLTGGSTTGTKNQGNQMLDMIVKIVGSKIASDALTGVIKSFMGNVMNDVKQGAVSNNSSIDVVSDLSNALSENNVDDNTKTDIINTVMNQIKNLM